MMKPAFKILIRTVSLGIFIACLFSIWAGGWSYAGYLQHQAGQYEEAYRAYQRAEKYNAYNAQLFYQAARNAWDRAEKKDDLTSLEYVRNQFKRMTEMVPPYAAGWLYLGLAELRINRLQNTLTREEAGRILQKFEKAYRLEPHSAWMAYMTGMQMIELQNAGFSGVDAQEALKRIKQSVQTRYPYQKSYYLDPALERIWDVTGDFHLLEQIVPEDAFSLYAMVQFLERRGLWRKHSETYTRYLNARKDLYTHLCHKGLGFLKNKEYDAALASFKTAFEVDPAAALAKAGILSLQEKYSTLTPEQLHQWLAFVLLQEEEDLSDLWPYLKVLTERSGDYFLTGLWFFRNGDYREALRYFKGTGDLHSEILLRYQAQSSISLGENLQAAEILRPLQQTESVDIRILGLLKEAGVLEKGFEMRRAATKHVGRTTWKKEGVFSGAAVNLKPGKARLYLALKKHTDSPGRDGYAMIRLWDHDQEQWIGSSAVTSPEWQPCTFEIETSGGWRWLQIEDYHSQPETPGSRTAGIEIGSAVIEY